MKFKNVLFIVPCMVIGLAFSSCKKCSSCNYTNAFGNKGPSFEVCDQEYENLKAQPDAEKYECVDI